MSRDNPDFLTGRQVEAMNVEADAATRRYFSVVGCLPWIHSWLSCRPATGADSL